jgi:hypothetical protein
VSQPKKHTKNEGRQMWVVRGNGLRRLRGGSSQRVRQPGPVTTYRVDPETLRERS